MSLLPTLLLTTGLLASAVSAEDRLSVGDRAPELSIQHFVKGERLDAFPTDKVTVVEFWATWCKPCIAGFPHLSELQEKWADQLIVVGVSDEELTKVEPFLAKPKHADVTHYRVATDPDGSMQTDWMVAAEQRGIPCAFIVDRDGMIQFIGHPMGMDRALERVITGKEPAAPERTAMSDEERAKLYTVEGSHSDGALALLDGLRSRLSAPGGVVAFEQEIVMRGALHMGGPDGEAMDLRRTRQGTLTLGGELGCRLDATRTMHLPGMGGMDETESVLFDGERMLLKLTSSSPFMPSPLPSDGWTQISRDEARDLAAEQPIPLPMLLMMDVNPVYASPLDALDAMLDMSALDVVQEEDGQVVLAGPAAPFAGVPDMAGMMDAEGAQPENNPAQLRLEFSPAGGGGVKLIVGSPEAPDLTMTLQRREIEGEHDASLFDAGDEEPEALLPILRERAAQMAGMGGH